MKQKYKGNENYKKFAGGETHIKDIYIDLSRTVKKINKTYGACKNNYEIREAWEAKSDLQFVFLSWTEEKPRMNQTA